MVDVCKPETTVNTDDNTQPNRSSDAMQLILEAAAKQSEQQKVVESKSSPPAEDNEDQDPDLDQCSEQSGSEHNSTHCSEHNSETTNGTASTTAEFDHASESLESKDSSSTTSTELLKMTTPEPLRRAACRQCSMRKVRCVRVAGQDSCAQCLKRNEPCLEPCERRTTGRRARPSQSTGQFWKRQALGGGGYNNCGQQMVFPPAFCGLDYQNVWNQPSQGPFAHFSPGANPGACFPSSIGGMNGQTFVGNGAMGCSPSMGGCCTSQFMPTPFYAPDTFNNFGQCGSGMMRPCAPMPCSSASSDAMCSRMGGQFMNYDMTNQCTPRMGPGGIGPQYDDGSTLMIMQGGAGATMPNCSSSCSGYPPRIAGPSGENWQTTSNFFGQQTANAINCNASGFNSINCNTTSCNANGNVNSCNTDIGNVNGCNAPYSCHNANGCGANGCTANCCGASSYLNAGCTMNDSFNMNNSCSMNNSCNVKNGCNMNIGCRMDNSCNMNNSCCNMSNSDAYANISTSMRQDMPGSFSALYDRPGQDIQRVYSDSKQNFLQTGCGQRILSSS
mmetsp:Transcript_20821/g.40459  ORF Transcript_20821/g.40459 Transcript_20821/m.40459 type:complete len:558 (-) Transcript_20821:246-1919(-)